MVKMLITMYKSESGKILVIDKKIHAFPFSLWDDQAFVALVIS